MGANPQATAEILNCGSRNQTVATAGDDQHWLPQLCRKRRIGKIRHGAERGIGPGNRRRPERQSRFGLKDGGGAGVAYWVRCHRVIEEWTGGAAGWSAAGE